MRSSYDVIVVGGGHAGCEAAAAAANLGSQVLLISMDLTKLAQMSCNPAIGGVGKGQIVREIDALGGYTGIVTDLTTIHFRMLNTSKGAAMWSPRAQCDRVLFSIEWRKQLEKIDNLSLLQDEVIDLNFNGSTIIGVRTRNGNSLDSKTVILTNGTFLNGLIHIGKTSFSGGRIGELPSIGLSEVLRKKGFEIGRMKTGTPVRIDGRSVNFDELIEQKTDKDGRFSFLTDNIVRLERRSCYIARTNLEVHNELRRGFMESPLFSGRIKGIGPRYCPSIEDKINTFSEKESHQLFLEPDGLDTYEMYLNGFSSSLPIDVQYRALTLIRGFERVNILRPGYAIEYDYFNPKQLKHTLESRIVKNLFFAGQINGTTGYEEAAGQGIVAGINAHLRVFGLEEFILNRDQGYIGVMIDDLVSKGVDEPYRVFTSRAEFRLLIRQDNADERLTPIGERLGLVKKRRMEIFRYKYEKINELYNIILKTQVEPNIINEYLTEIGSAPINQKKGLREILLRPDVFLNQLETRFQFLDFSEINSILEQEILQSLETKIKYLDYIEKEKLLAQKLSKLEYIKISSDFDFTKLQSLSIEARQKLDRYKPQTIGEAKRIPGVTPADINVLLVYFGR